MVTVENKDIASRMTIAGDITCMSWSEERGEEDVFTPLIQNDTYRVFLPRLPSLSRGKNQRYRNAKGIENQKNLNLLFVGLKSGELLISVFGLYPRVYADIPSLLQVPECQFLDAGCSKYTQI